MECQNNVGARKDEIAIEIEIYQIDSAAIQEIRWSGNKTIERIKYTLLHSST